MAVGQGFTAESSARYDGFILFFFPLFFYRSHTNTKCPQGQTDVDKDFDELPMLSRKIVDD